MEKDPNTSPLTAWKELKKQAYSGGVKLTTKELRDYFATQVSAQVTDPNTVKALMRHTSLNTTSRYTRTVMERMKAAVQNLGKPLEAGFGGNSGGKSIPKTTQNDKLNELRLRLVRARNARESVGGGGGSRTHDAADMSRVSYDEDY
jgi:integrase-like protein